MTTRRKHLLTVVTLLIGLFATVALAQTATEVEVAQVLEVTFSE